tara:strand:- start:83 stop:244 length:162 start_codon:yes stop_codon:yes gene_type:complete
LENVELKKSKKMTDQKNDRFLKQITINFGPPSLGEPITEIFERGIDENKIRKI